MAKEPETLEQLAAEGRNLLTERNPVRADNGFRNWDSAVAIWLDDNFPGTGKSAKWSSLGSSQLKTSHGYSDYDEAWRAFRGIVQNRLQWLSRLNHTATKRTAEHGRKTLNSRTDL
jgi:hypothetical protein